MSTEEKTIKEELNVELWMRGKLNNLQINEVLKTIGNSSSLTDVVKKYSLKMSFTNISERLNNYVHSNGILFYNDNTALTHTKEYLEQVKQLINDLKYIVTTFFVLLTICCPHLISSNDYVDYLEAGEMPPEGSQYLVAPFIADFIKSNYLLIDENCLKYLQDNTCMRFDFKE